MTLKQHLTTSDLMETAPSQFFGTDGIRAKTEVTSPIPDSPEPTPAANRKLAWKVAPNLFISFKYAWAGLTYAFVTQRNFRIHTIIGTVAIGLGIFLHRSAIEMSAIGLTIALVMTLELLNTALESVVDLTVKQSYHELAKIAKDCAAGAVLIAAIAAIFVASLILIPPLYVAIVTQLR
ncbi:diacylglycerol kinase family protein [Oscillatoria sp. FACHB-1406]|uniref:diacylglycerol kinase family protein n=1 Tax=Oscillatoria sp. FACHB-1406 TaxID=2692846 RepID=UPI0016825A51|nr:diacylglycerol kinase family protein [Oscillatoria sp. FACHB-1406]MBD2577890.1 diacylglycerol kinase family protein [Oscillatoria sp. FACHB-1406]